MPRYHFHLSDGQKIMDPTGREFPDPEAAKRHGESLMAGLARVDPQAHIRITDEAGDLVARCRPASVRREH